jgi:small subunit ribosomal protein S6
MAKYEIVVIARQDISSAAAEALAEQFSGVLTELGSEIVKTEHWGLRGLSYKIKKNRKGHYFLLGVEAPAAAVHELDRLLKLNEDVLRHMIIRVEEIEEGQSAILTSRGERGDRPERGGRRGDRPDRPDRPRREYGDRSDDSNQEDAA